ncbi:MAG: hypothetical protein KY443_08025 [Actinobacteria bacterium]|nr:hypothetical protein [Actinomycetota bacterium]
MRRPGSRSLHVSEDLIQVVLDDETAERLRQTASERGMEVEQLIVDLLHTRSLELATGNFEMERGAVDSATGPTTAS